MRGSIGVRKRWLLALLGIMLVAASCAADDGASDTAASAMAEAQSAQSDAEVALADAQAAAAKAREAQAAADTATAAAALAQATAEGNQAAVAQAEADLAAAQAAADQARSDAAAAQAEADQARGAAEAAAAAAAEAEAAATAPEPMAEEELILTVGVPGDIQTLDPCCTNFIRGHEAQLIVSDTPVIHPIVEQDGALVAVADQVEPVYFESWEEHADGVTYTIKVREGVTFDDGTEVTAETVRFWVDRNLNTPGGGAWLLTNIAFIDEPPEVIDRYTLQFTANAPSPMVMQQFYMTSSVPVDPKVVEKYATEDDPWAIEHFQSNVENPSGPYRIASWLPDQEVVFEKRENYWGRERAYDKIIWKIIPSNAERVQLLSAGVIDVAIGLGTEDFAALQGVDGVVVQRFPSKNQAYLGMGNSIAPFDDVLVRQAVSYAVDYEDIITNVYKNEAQRLRGALPNGSAFSIGDQIGYDRDVDRARELLAESGYDGSPVSLSIDAGKGEHELIAVRVQSHLAEIGMDVEIEVLTAAVFAERKAGKQLQFFVDEALAWIDDPNYLLSLLLESGVFGNYTDYNNARVDEIIRDGWAEKDPAVRRGMFEEAQRIISEDAPWVFLAQPDYKIALRDNVGGYALYPNEIPRLADLYPLDQ
ncbi:MAG: ABC transporter substrate-binding protein [bacterium]|nr:ABC transporter substrate-binding protein [bacterium]MCY4105022.1 ABC transporter substrate-binding protein [bacterium]